MNRRNFLINAAIAGTAAGQAQVQSSSGSRSSKGADVVVIGAGAFGGWTAFYLRQMGASVTLVDSYGPGNTRSSSGGETRLIRADYGTQLEYTRMALQAFRLWKQWQQEWGTRLLVPTGRLVLGKASARADLEARKARLTANGVPTEFLERDELKRRWPQIHTDDVPMGIYNPPEPSGSLLMAREACRAVAAAFERNGGRFQIAKAAPGSMTGGRLESVKTQAGGEIRADLFIFACGPWLPKLFPALFESTVRVFRRDVIFVGTPPGDDRFSAPHLPAWGADHEDWYGFPSVDGRGLKACPTDESNTFDPDTDERLVNAYQIKRAHDYVTRRFPALRDQPIVESRVCQVTYTSDRNFVIDRHPELSNVWLAGAGSGHAFKHGPALGEYLAKRALRQTGDAEWDALFRLKPQAV